MGLYALRQMCTERLSAEPPHGKPKCAMLGFQSKGSKTLNSNYIGFSKVKSQSCRLAILLQACPAGVLLQLSCKV